MSAHCIINGCKNYETIEENVPGKNTSFHVLPSNPVLKKRWLKAIGRSDWEPPNYASICSDHFSAFQLNSNFDGSLVEVCRICLATNDDTKLYSIQQGNLKQYMDTILTINNDPSLPQFVCFECAALLRKCYNMIKRSETSQAVLFEMFEQDGEITKSLIKNLNRENLEIKSSLEPHGITPTYLFNYQFNYEQNFSCLTNIEYIYDLNENKKELELKFEPISIKTDVNDISENLQQDANCVIKEEGTNEILIVNIVPENNENKKRDAICVLKSVSGHVSGSDNETDVENCNELSIDFKNNSAGLLEERTDGIPINEDENNKIESINIKKCAKRSKAESKRETTQARNQSENEVTKHFNIVKLVTLQEQIEEWNKAMENPTWMRNKTQMNNVQKCEVCSKLFANVKTYKQHRAYHDLSYGNAECPVCKIRHKSEKLLRKHMKTHNKKYYCKLCPKTFFTRTAAGRHYSDHIGREYKCGRCSYSTRHRALLSVHKRSAHSHAYACELCGRSCVSRGGLQRHHQLQHPGQPPIPESNNKYPCEECKLSFTTEEALRVHLLTAVQHMGSNTSSFTHTCRYCDLKFTSFKRLREHIWSTHIKSLHKTSSTRTLQLPKSTQETQEYPIVCEHCDEIFETRRDNYWHLMREHHDKRDSYKPVITVVCEVCGKGFKNKRLLEKHKLRHSTPKVPCPVCNKLFYDKALMEQHEAGVHREERPYVCLTCGIAIKTKSNFNRHMKIHTDVTPYECSLCGKQVKHKANLRLHIRTVHHKILYPSVLNRKKRTRNGRAGTKTDATSGLG